MSLPTSRRQITTVRGLLSIVVMQGHILHQILYRKEVSTMSHIKALFLDKEALWELRRALVVYIDYCTTRFGLDAGPENVFVQKANIAYERIDQIDGVLALFAVEEAEAFIKA
jgi:hypothetical protein